MKRRILNSFLALFLFGFASLAFAQGPTPPGPGGPTPPPGGGGAINLPNPLACDDVQCVVQNIVRGILVIVTPIVVIMVLIGAFQILTAGGSPERVTKGRNTIFYAVVGYAIVLVAQGLVFIIKEVLGDS
jgi:hypothetical protein